MAVGHKAIAVFKHFALASIKGRLAKWRQKKLTTAVTKSLYAYLTLKEQNCKVETCQSDHAFAYSVSTEIESFVCTRWSMQMYTVTVRGHSTRAQPAKRTPTT